jgi:hypothetical protein
MRALPLLLLILLPTTALASTGLSGCKEDNTICREDCSVEHGSSSRTYSKLNACLGKCRDKFNLCRERHLALKEEETLGIERNPASAPTVPRDPTRFTETQDEPPEEKAPAASASPEPSVRRGVYRASEPEPAPAPKPVATKPAPAPAPAPEEEEERPEPAPARAEPTKAPAPMKVAEPAKPAPSKPAPAKPAPVAASKPDPLLDDEGEEPPPPPPKPKPPPPTRPALPPEPKKDISDWDPNGD